MAGIVLKISSHPWKRESDLVGLLTLYGFTLLREKFILERIIGNSVDEPLGPEKKSAFQGQGQD